MTPHTLQIENLTIGYKKPLLHPISFCVQAPCLIGLVGNNGIGKTTLLKTISGIQKKIDGRILFNQKELNHYTNSEWAKIVSLGLSSSQDVFPISVLEFVSAGRYPYIHQMALLSVDDENTVQQALSILKIEHLQQKNIFEISDGERQKACIAKVLAQQTPLILLDEPTAFLDYSSKKNLFHLMKKETYEKKGITLISSHDVDFLTRYADYVLLFTEQEEVVFNTTSYIVNQAYFQQHFTI
ncbi:MAG: ABC transporter ATP-binding protein [Bacteroidetes bacterium]|nr:ABC transporter ATP-binding protein [Bacteroidota bacterium]